MSGEECLEKCEEDGVEIVVEAEEFEEEIDWEEKEFEDEELPKKKHRRRKTFAGSIEAEEEDDGEEDEDYEDESTTSEDYSSESSYEEIEAITFEWEDEVYEFVELVKPKRLKNIFHEKPVKDEVDFTNKKSYLHIVNSLHVPPVEHFYKSLEENEIDLSYYGINPKGMRGICKILEGNTKVRSLSLKDNKLTEEACHHLGLLLSANKTLTCLNLTGCRIGSEGIRALGDSLSENDTLKILNLTKCYIGDEGMKFLAEGIKFNNGLQALNLSYNNLANEGAEALGSCFRYNTSICDLDLNFNDMFDLGGLRGFFKGMMDNEGVTKLALSWNALGGEEIGKIITAFLKKRKTIKYLDLSANRLDRPTLDEIQSGLESAKSLEVLKLGNNPIPSDMLDSLLGTVTGLQNLKILDLEDLWVKKSFIQTLDKIKENRDIDVVIGGVLSNYEIKGPDYKKILLDRAQYEAMKPKAKKAKKDFGRFLWSLGDEPMSKEEFMERVRRFKAKISSALFPQLLKEFQISKTDVDVKAMREKYLTLYPHSQPGPEKKKKDEALEGEAAEEQIVADVEAGEEENIEEGDEADEEEAGDEMEGVEEFLLEKTEEDEAIEFEGEIIEETSSVKSLPEEEKFPTTPPTEELADDEPPELRDQIEDDA